MTGPEDSHTSTRPISVAELLAKNGTIGAPPVGGRRRRRRGNTDSVTVAELTGEIPIVVRTTLRTRRPKSPEPSRRSDADRPGRRDAANGVADHVDEVETPRRDRIPKTSTKTSTTNTPSAVADYAAHLEQRDVDPDPVDFFAPPPRRPQYTPDTRRYRGPATTAAPSR